MATFIFGENKLQNPVFVQFSVGYKDIKIMQSTGMAEDGKTHTVEILKEVSDARKQLKNGIKTVNSKGDEIVVKLKHVFIIEKLEVYYNNELLKGHEFIEFRIGLH